MQDNNQSQPQIELAINPPTTPTPTPTPTHPCHILRKIKHIIFSILCKFHAGYFRISLSLCSQALLWKTLGHLPEHVHPYRRALGMLFPSSIFILIWSLGLLTLLLLSLLYALKLLSHFDMVKSEFLHRVGVNYLFAPWISSLLLLESNPFFTNKSYYYLLLWWVFVVPIFVLDVKIYGQWFIKGKRSLVSVANPTSQLSVIGNLIGARAAAEMGWKESAICLFSLGMLHYLVLFVTLYQRLSGTRRIPTMLRPVFFLFFAAPSMGSLAWGSINGSFDNSSKMLFFLSLFLFMSLVSRPTLFKKSMRKFNVAWWAYSYPLTLLALASTEYAQAVKSTTSHLLMLFLAAVSIVVPLVLLVFTAFKTNMRLPTHNDNDDPISSPN